jgi:hypothetical protein
MTAAPVPGPPPWRLALMAEIDGPAFVPVTLHADGTAAGAALAAEGACAAAAVIAGAAYPAALRRLVQRDFAPLRMAGG